MWFKLVNANFSANSLGKMSDLSNSWQVYLTYSGGISKVSGSGSVAKGGTWTGTFTLAEGATFTSVTLSSGSASTPEKSISGSTVTVTVKNVASDITLALVATGASSGGSGGTTPPVNPPSGGSNYTLIHGNKYAAGHETNPARASISPLTIIVPNGVTITNKSTIKWAYYTGVNTNNMPSGTGSGTWGDYKYTGTGAAIGISFKKVDDSAFDWSIDSTNPADYFDVSDEGLWNGTAEGTTPEPEEPEGAEGTLDINAFNAMTLTFGNPFGTTEQQSDPARAHSEVNLYAPAGTVISLIDNTNYKWALKKVTGATGKTVDSTFNSGNYVPDAVWSVKKNYTTTVNGYWKFVLLKASNAAFDWSTDSQKISDYFTVS